MDIRISMWNIQNSPMNIIHIILHIHILDFSFVCDINTYKRMEGDVLFSILLLIIYISFISLGLPDAVMGAAWPVMHTEFSVPLSAMGPVGLTISLGTVISSLLSDGITRRFGTGLVTAVSVTMTAIGLLGFGLSQNYWMLYLWAIPYGLGAGSVDTTLNNYVAVHHDSRHMSWLHCMWGIGASAGPYIMSFVLAQGLRWNHGYFFLFALQGSLGVVLFATLSKWNQTVSEPQADHVTSSQKRLFRIRGIYPVMLLFFCYCALESTVGQWSASYLVSCYQLSPESAAGFAGLFYLGLTGGRFLSGFLTFRFGDKQMVRIGLSVMALGIFCMILPAGIYTAAAGLILIGLGCAPVFPCSIHATPALFGASRSQGIIGIQMASAYVGICLVPPLYGAAADLWGSQILPMILFALCGFMYLSHEYVYRTTRSIA